MDFEAYLIEKKIDGRAFKAKTPKKWEEFKFLFDQMHPNSFTAQKLYAINPLRRQFPLKLEDNTSSKQKKSTRPIIKPKLK